MAYLNSPRLVFSGDFLSDVSTVNNDPAHYNNATFASNFQEPGTGSTNGWWNPEGGAIFDFRNCVVQQVVMPDGTVNDTSAADLVVGQIVGGPGNKATGKMVDLDPQAQLCSQLWTITLRIYTPENELLLQGDMSATPFRDLQIRQLKGARINGQPLGASWTSVLTNLVWGAKTSQSPFLSELKTTTQGNQLSINLNAFGYYYNHAADGRFSMGKVLGAIGPWFNGEPELFAPARRLYGTYQVSAGTIFSNSNFIVEKKSKRINLDLGNCFPISDALGTIAFDQKLILGVSKKPLNNAPDTQKVLIQRSDFIQIGTVNYETGPSWLSKTGGIVSIDNLSDEALTQLKAHQLLLLTPTTTSQEYMLLAREAIDGLLVRADNFVQRIDTNETNQVRLYAYQWGRPLANTYIVTTLEPPTPVTPVDPVNNPICEIPGNNYPVNGISFQPAVMTDARGFALLSIHGNKIKSPRGYIDGQIYTLDIQLQNIANDPAGYNENIFIHLRDYFKIPEHPSWSDIADTMTQYSNLYPLMSRYVANLADPVALKAKKDIFIFAFSRDIQDVMHMPVTRDLSRAKRQTILKWLTMPESETIALASKTAITKPLAQSPAHPNTPLTAMQQQLKEAVKAKNGSVHVFEDIEITF